MGIASVPQLLDSKHGTLVCNEYYQIPASALFAFVDISQQQFRGRRCSASIIHRGLINDDAPEKMRTR